MTRNYNKTMLGTFNTTSARNVQRNYKTIVTKIKQSKQPIIVINKNQPEVAIVSLDLLERYEQLQNVEHLWTMIDDIRTQNASIDPDTVYQEITKEVDLVRQKNHEKTITSSRS